MSGESNANTSNRNDFMHIMSWNVASWKTTSQKIKQRYNSLENFFQSINADIICLQEVKIEKSDIEIKGLDYGAKMIEYDSFWGYPKSNNVLRSNSNNQGKSQTKGLNGVVTFVKKGFTIHANSRIFNDSTLDNEGRCIVTEHENFVLFNCYVPFSGMAYERMPFRIKFLKALSLKMQEYRNSGKSVMLVGDLNIAPRSIDSFYGFRRIDIPKTLQLYSEQKLSANLCDSKVKLLDEIIYVIEKYWLKIKLSLNEARTVDEEFVNNKVFYRVGVTFDDGKKVSDCDISYSHYIKIETQLD